ncbi:MAG: extensin family protein [Myxococcales bacterium]|nr:extensin family protein [Myxococcales bacterium]MCB9575507.1 extensin family protein [Polyangiaceae bacterium]
MRALIVSALAVLVASASGCAAAEQHREPSTLLRASEPTPVPAPREDAPTVPDEPAADQPPDEHGQDAGVADAEAAPEAPEPEPEHYAFQDLVNPPPAAKTPAHRWANLSPAACRAELAKQKLAVGRARRATPGVANPRRITGKIGGVRFVAPGGKSPYGILDCRLALTLVDMAAVLTRHDVASVRVDNFYRPKAHLPGKHAKSQHAYGLAMDVFSMTLADGRELSVERDWHGTVGDKACGAESQPEAPTPETVALHDIVCDLARAGVFHHLLTPGFNAAHRNHLHLDIKRGDTAVIVH